jgi:hypothetical protein
MESMLSTTDEQQPVPWGDALARELVWVHSKIRHDLDVIQRLAGEVLAGADPERIRAEIAAMQTNSPLWKLRVNCLYYCRVVHLHHSIEDRQLFPAIRRANPALDPVVDRLEDDHRRVSNHLDEVETATDELMRDDTEYARQRLVAGLQTLSEHLLAHLDFEEESILPAMREWVEWPLK